MAEGKLVQVSILGHDVVEFTNHALNRMAERGVTEEDVLRTIQRPTRRGLPTQPGRSRVRWMKTRHTAIDVVYQEFTEEWKRLAVITVIRIESGLARRRS